MGLRVDGSQYQLLSRLGAGGMAEIFLARQKSLAGFERDVVIKRVRPERANSPDLIAGFIDEARLSAQLNHPNIAQVFDFGRLDGSYFIAMEYIRGFDLALLLETLNYERSHMPIEAAIRIMCDVLAGVDYAHNAIGFDGQRLGIVHRDVTPSNVIISASGQAKVVDFGIARAKGRSDTRTRTGVIKGKYSYLAPEQLEGRTVDHRVDIFACGIVLYELLTGYNPFQAEYEYQSILRILKASPPPMSDYRKALPTSLQAIVAHALRPNPDERYQSASTMRQALEDVACVERLSLATTSVTRLLAELEPRIAQRKQQEAAVGAAQTRAVYRPELHRHTTQVHGLARPPRRWLAWTGGGLLLAVGAAAWLWRRSHGRRPN